MRIGYRLTMTQPLHRTTFRAVALIILQANPRWAVLGSNQ